MLIDGGQIPALIMVFDAHNGAPIPDSECVDSLNGRQQLETYMTQTVVRYVDSTYRTIPTAAARALFGFSEGGYCAPMLLLRHPDVFNEAIAMSGYFQAAIVTRVTINAALPFGGDQQMITDHSPLALLPTLPADVRSRLFLVVSADSRERLYGPQFQAFSAALAQNGYHYVLMPTRLGHAWNAVRTTLPLSLQVVAGRWVTLGVLGA
jgi:enterochelin esterase-like enzyme